MPRGRADPAVTLDSFPEPRFHPRRPVIAMAGGGRPAYPLRSRRSRPRSRLDGTRMSRLNCGVPLYALIRHTTTDIAARCSANLAVMSSTSSAPEELLREAGEGSVANGVVRRAISSFYHW